MFKGASGRLVWMVAVVLSGSFLYLSFGSDKAGAGAKALSKALARVELFAGLTDQERDALKAAATLRHAKAGERIIEQGKARDRMFIILEGGAEIWVNGEHLLTHSAQTLVGEIEFLDSCPASADVVLTQETDLIELNYAALTALMEERPRLGYVLMREIAGIEARRLRNTTPK